MWTKSPSLLALSERAWQKHVENNHEPFRRDGLTCVMSRGVGKRHARISHPDSYVLTSDLTGPIKPGLDTMVRGSLTKSMRYILVARYAFPTEFLKSYRGGDLPQGPGLHLPEEDNGDGGGIGPLGDKELDLEAAPNHQEEPPGEVREDDIRSNEEGELVLEDEVVDEPAQGSFGDEDVPESGEEADDKKNPLESSGEDGEPAVGKGHKVMVQGDCEAPEMSYLVFSTALPDNKNATIRAALQDVVLYIASLGMPVMRFHADRGEFFSTHFRAWLRNQGIRATWSEPGVPQSNGMAERTVRWIKDRARTLLRGGGLPLELWPAAVETAAAAEQRAKVLGWRSKLMAPFGSRVHLKKRPFTAKGPRRKAEALESKWTSGHYVGLSGLIDNGHLVYIPPGDDGPEDKGGFLHTMHVRAHLHDPGPPVDELDVELPDPVARRRITGKRRPAERKLQVPNPSQEEIAKYATSRAAELLETWNLEDAKMLVEELGALGFFEMRKFGAYRHGGVVGTMRGSLEFPELTKLMAGIITDTEPSATFTAMWVARNVERGVHQDQNNAGASYNYVVPIVCPDKGGELWVELESGDVVTGKVTKALDKDGREMYGQLLPLTMNTCNVFSPRRRHQILPWKGERQVLIGYTPECMGKLTYEDIERLEELGFVVPTFQFPEAGLRSDVKLQGVATEGHEVPPADGSGNNYLEIDKGWVCIDPLLEKPLPEAPSAKKVEVGYTRNIEKLLSELASPLEVTHNVHPDEVVANIEAWEPAIRKEVNSVSVAIQKLLVGTEERNRWFARPGAQRLPAKFVFTIKPRDDAVTTDPTTWFKRKARLVVCGNMATNECGSVYTEAAPAESVRAALVMTVKNSWVIGVLDVVTAFLRTPIGETKGDPVIMIQPPKLLERMGITSSWELWGLVRALYGLKESPRLWGAYRDKQLAGLKVTIAGAIWCMRQGKAITSWWTVRDEHERVQAVVVVYVDDFLLCGQEPVIRQLAKEIQTLWETSDLRLLQRDVDPRFLGMELHYEDNGSLSISQGAYVQELLRSHGVENPHCCKVPLSREHAVLEVPEEEAGANLQDIRDAQQRTGEILWLSQRSRPDLAYLSSIMASLSTRSPRRAIQLGQRALGYLFKTRWYRLGITFDGNQLSMYCDAAFAPEGGRSHEGWAVMWAGTPILWRSGRQSLTSLSTGESELIAILNGTLGMLSVESMLCDLDVRVDKREVRSDSTAALAIASGGSSWRTRHLRIKANWLFEHLQSGYVTSKHCAGVVQLADLLTKSSGWTKDYRPTSTVGNAMHWSKNLPYRNTKRSGADSGCDDMLLVGVDNRGYKRGSHHRGGGLQERHTT